jgi:hypothetical protein
MSAAEQHHIGREQELEVDIRTLGLLVDRLLDREDASENDPSLRAARAVLDRRRAELNELGRDR